MKRITKLTFASLTFALAAPISGCATSERATNTEANSAQTAQARPAVEPVMDVSESKPAFRAELATQPAQVKAGELVTLSFNVKDAKGAAVRDLQVVHEKPMHLLIVSNDLAEFYHIHPEPQRDGSFKVTHTFPKGGAYKLYADFTPPNATQIVERLDVYVAGNVRPRAALVADKTNTNTVDGLRITMRPDKPLRAGEELMLNFAAADAKTGKPATDLQPYLGSLAHFVIISEDTTDFLHAHPMTKDEMSEAGGAHGSATNQDAKPHAHDAADIREETKQKSSPSEVAAHTTFPRAGLYKVWAQFQRGGRVITLPYVVRVAENQMASAGNASSSAAHIVPPDAIKVTISSKGYEPSRVEVKKGQTVKLAFYRADADNCGGEIVFPSVGIRRKLSVGESVIIELTPKETGEVAFTCGMGMYRGALVVAE